MAAWVIINGEFVKEEAAFLHIRDLAFLRGYGVFDFFKFQHGEPVFLKDHLQRFFFSAAAMHLEVSLSENELHHLITELIGKNGQDQGGIRITLTGGYSTDGYQPAKPNLVVSQHEFQSPGVRQFNSGIHLMLADHQRQLPHVKTIDYLMAISLQPKVKQQGADDILYHAAGYIRECPRANIFFVTQDHRLVTPREGILKGITRKKIIELAAREIPVEEREIHLDELPLMKEAFITSTTKMVLPVNRINGHPYTSNQTASRYQALLQQLQAASTIRMGQDRPAL